MSESDDTQQNDDLPVEQGQEPETVDLAEAAGKEAAKQVPSKPNLNSDEFSPEQVAKIEAMMESRAQSESNRAVNKFKEKVEKSGEYISREDFQTQLQAELTAERERNELASQAKESFNQHMGKLGIVPGSEKYKAVAKAYTEMEADGAITPKALLKESGVRALAFAAGVIEPDAASGPQSGFDTSHRLEVNAPKPGQETLDDKAWEAVNKALGY